MSQHIVLETLRSFEQGATREQLKQTVEAAYPDRSLHAYLQKPLAALVDKNVVATRAEGGDTVYYISDESSVPEGSLDSSLYDLDRAVNADSLARRGIDVVNIVGGGTLDSSVDLHRLGTEIPEVGYEPESTPMATWKPIEDSSATLLIPASGVITMVGCTDSDDIRQLFDVIERTLSRFCEAEFDVDQFETGFQIHNVVCSAELGRELHLPMVALGLGLERAEYEPDQFPGLIYKQDNKLTVLLFRTGKVVLTSAQTYEEILDGYRAVVADLRGIGVELE